MGQLIWMKIQERSLAEMSGGTSAAQAIAFQFIIFFPPCFICARLFDDNAY